MTPSPLIPFIPRSKRTRTLYLCLYLCTETNTHTALLFFCIIQPLIQETSAPLNESQHRGCAGCAHDERSYSPTYHFRIIR